MAGEEKAFPDVLTWPAGLRCVDLQEHSKYFCYSRSLGQILALNAQELS